MTAPRFAVQRRVERAGGEGVHRHLAAPTPLSVELLDLPSVGSATDMLSDFALAELGVDLSAMKVHARPCQARALQRKPSVPHTGDTYEREADHVADQIMRMPDTGAPSSASAGLRRADTRGVGARIIPHVVDEALSSPGQPLDAQTRAFMETRFGHDFGHIRVHTDARAAEASQEMNALAFASGDDVVFATGSYSPHTERGQHLLAHELTHVLQQSSGVRARRPAAVQCFGLALDFEKLARQIRKAVSGPGTDEEAIYRALTQLQRDPATVAELEAAYARLYTETLMHALEDDLSSDELDYAKGLMGKPVAAGSKHKVEPIAPTTPAGWDAQARRIKAAVEYRTWGIFGGTDEEAIFAVLAPLGGDANKIAEIKKAYARITGGRPSALVDAIRSEMSGSELNHALQLLTVPDPHAGTQTELSRDQVLAVRNELLPGTAVAAPAAAGAPLPAPALWDGRAGAPGAAANRATLKAQLTADLTAHLARVMVDIAPLAAAPKVPIAAMEGAANAAVEVTDDEYKSWYEVSAATPGQAALRAGFHFSAAAGNLRDATDPAARAALGIPLSAASVTHWMVRNDDPPAPPGAIEHMAAHNFDPDRTTHGEDTWLSANVITPFIGDPTRHANLLLYDQFGFALQPDPGKIVLPTALPGSSLATGGAPNLADRKMLWSTWHVAVHEYLHNLVHPAFQAAIQGPVMNEGFTEYFTKGVLTKVAPVAHMNKALINDVEGGIFAPATTQAMVGLYATPPTYAANLGHVEAAASAVPGADNAIRSAYFQGHVEMLGIDPATNRFVVAPPASVDPTLVNVPAGMANLDDLADRSGVGKSEILAANPGLAPAAPLPPKLKLPGAREHRVAATVVLAGVAPVETADQIAAQNGVSVEALKRANPTVAWAALARGQLLLIPRH